MKKLLFLLIFIIPRFLFAGTSVIEIKTEGWGTITKTTGQTNLNGAIVWNGTEWVANNTWAHKFFVDTRTGNRLKDPEIININNVLKNEFDTLNYHILRQNYTYTYPAKDGGLYTYIATENVLTCKSTGKQIVLRSRGSGNGIGKPYFDIYFEDEVTGGGQNITAFRDDPKWYNYPGMTMAQALEQTDTVQNLTGNFPTNKGWYFLDFGGGGDLGPEGVGKSYIFRTDSLPPVAKTASIASSYPVDFAVRYMDSSGNLHELRFLPKLISETYIPLGAPTVTTDSISNVFTTVATVWGKVTADGGSVVTERGIVYSTGSNPTVGTGTKIKSGSGIGPFTATFKGLAPNTTYHVRAFATSSKGTTYGADKNFSTLQSNVIHPLSEGSGVIKKSSGETNLNGAMVWDGKNWVVNNTHAHGYFASSSTGERLQFVEIIKIQNGETNTSYDTLDYHVTRQNYSYSYPARDRGTFTYMGTEFIAQHKTTGKQTVLRSRGSGNGIGKAYFDIYIENEDTTGNPKTITALRNDPKWFTYSGMTMAQVLVQTDTVQNLTGNFPTAGGWYFLDVAGGGDYGPAGKGKSYIFHTDPLSPVAKTAGIVSSYPIDFALRFMDSNGYVHELDFLPKLTSEIYTPPAVAPLVTTDSITSVSASKASVWGKVASDGGSTVTERGIIYSTVVNPTTGNGTKVTAGTGNSVFSATLTGLTANTTYHVRAYAINAKGSSYGADKSFLATDAKLAVISSGLGTIRKISGEANFNGAMVWNCKEWLVNNTYAHRTNASPATGDPLQKVNVINIPNSTTDETIDTMGYRIVKRSYSWEFPAKDGGTYSFAAMEYVIILKATGRQVVLRTRGAGNGNQGAYFDMYAENEPGTCNQSVVTALRNGGLWFSYPGKTIEQALAQSSLTQNLTGSFATPDGLYFLDMGCGGDMGPAGTGKSFVFHTGSQLPADVKTADPGPSFPTDFGLRFMNGEGNVYELHFLPALIGEIYTSPVKRPLVTADSITAVTNTGATIWGNVTAGGGSPVTGRGIVYSTSVNPTLETAAKISAGTGPGPFSSTLTGLAGGTYFVRTYATNAKGTAYANFGRFETRNNQSIISIWTEGWGSVVKGTGETNPFGAMVWNGTEWIVNNTWLHKYFASVPSGKRLKEIPAIKIANTSTYQVVDTLGYKITRGNYSYSTLAKEKGSYSYSAVEYTLEDKTSGRQVVLRSRGTGNGTTGAYFDIFIENETTSGNSVTALRDGPNWLTWQGMTLQQALAQVNPTQGLTGTLPAPGGWYFMDMENGADLGPAGIGKSYVFHSDSIQSVAKTVGNGPVYPVDFAFRWMDASGNVHEFDFLPKLVSETYTAPFTVTTDSITTIITSGFTVWGNVVSGGGKTVNGRGLVYSISLNPTLAKGTKVASGSGTGIFSIPLTGLLKEKMYHVRAYAINSSDTVYGDDRSFIPNPGFITFKSEGTGNITKNTGETNAKGAFVWDCHGWQVNKSWEHRYLTNGISGDRLLSTEVITIPTGESKVVFDTLNYLITRESYTYSYPAKDGGSYKYTAVSYLVKDNITGKQISLRSRGYGNGVSNAFFDIYLESITRNCSPDTITALRGDPLWFTYPGNTLLQAVAQTSATAGLTGSLHTTGGWYFMDAGFGGDIGPAGFGSSFTFHTATTLPVNSKISDLGSSYPSDFSIRMTDISGNLHELKFLPKLISETYVPVTGIGDLPGNENTVIKVYPNPFTNEFRVSGLKTKAMLYLYDLSGRLLFSKELIGDGLISAGSIPAGMYIVRIITEERSWECKIIKK